MTPLQACSNSTVGWVFALHVPNMSLIPDIAYSPQVLSKYQNNCGVQTEE